MEPKSKVFHHLNVLLTFGYFCTMRVLKQLFDFYLNSNVHVALAVCSLSIITHVLFDLFWSPDLIWFTLFGTISSYNFVQYFGLARFHHRSLATWLKQIQIFSLLCFIPLIYFAMQLELRTLLLFGAFGLITFFYAIPFLPRRFFVEGGTNLRAVSGLKIYVISAVWIGVAGLIPMVTSGHIIGNDEIIWMIQLGLYVFVATLPFEIRDIRYDSLKLGTIPQQIGVLRTKWIGSIFLVILVMLEFFKDDLIVGNFAVLTAVALVVLSMLWISKTEQGKYYSLFWVEAIPIFWLVVLWVVNY